MKKGNIGRLTEKIRMKIAYRRMTKELTKMVGLNEAGYLIAGILDSFDEMAKNGNPFELRSLKLVFNDFFEKEIIK